MTPSRMRAFDQATIIAEAIRSPQATGTNA
jgi:hypothetical protein